MFAFLEAPNGQLLSRQDNVTGVAPDGSLIFTRSIQEFRADPVPGRWTFVVSVLNPVAGTTTAQRFSGEVRFNTVDVHAAGVPNGPATVLPAGHPVTARVTVHNTGIAPESFFVDPRRTARTDQRLITTDPETGVPVPPSPPINYLVPTECNRVTTTATAPVPIDAELFSSTMSPFVIGRSASTRPAVASVSAAQVTPGPWVADASLVGPFPPGGVPPTSADFITVGHCRAFDATITSTTGDIWLTSVDPSPPPFTPLVLQPGQTGTITVTITPTGPPGTVVTGNLFIDDFSNDTGGGDELATIPYTYTVG